MFFVGFNQLDSLFSLAFSPGWNPMYQLGAMSFLYFWIVAITGVYLFIFFETSISGAYSSIEYITVEQWDAETDSVRKITLSPNQLRDLAAALNLPEGIYHSAP